ncbi:hypothetical protein CSC65_04535 [Pseudoxanthomonas daejeonensis]|uniref:Uncharacterized protein n=1 Tax=Pseudoxanthomonas daejeonensis TaxID=266062 RepID=A0ABQ6ZA92_9GAMM|nr:hypothetical protein CSC65_04535 [Pseudoxanthomonas daejeonensis]
MWIAKFMSHLFPSPAPSRERVFIRPGLGESRPTGHFREFTVPPRYQRGGVGEARKASKSIRCPDGIIPCVGGNIP